MEKKNEIESLSAPTPVTEQDREIESARKLFNDAADELSRINMFQRRSGDWQTERRVRSLETKKSEALKSLLRLELSAREAIA